MAALEHTTLITKLLNKAIGAPVAKILDFIGLPYNKEMVIPNHLATTWVLMAIIIGTSLIATRKLNKIPSGFQHILELFVEFINYLLDDVIGHKGRKFFPLIATLAIFIFLSNLAGLVPGLVSPTNNLNTTIACALVVFVYYHIQGIKQHGFLNYLKTFAGPPQKGFMIVINIIMVPIEIISHFARPLSLSLRLFGNIMGEDIVLIILFMLAPYFVPLPMMLLAIFTSFIQAFIFIMLSMLYLANAIAEEH